MWLQVHEQLTSFINTVTHVATCCKHICGMNKPNSSDISVLLRALLSQISG